MKALWAPWRMDYIRSAQHTKPDECFLCDLFRASADRDNLVLRRSELCALLLNRYPYSSGHLMAAPLRHVDSLQGLTEAEMADLMKRVVEGLNALGQALRPDGFNVGVNLGEAAGAGLKTHVHIHIVPRWHGDTNFMPTLADVKVIPQSLADLRDQLERALT